MCVLDMLYCGVLYVGMHVRMMSRLTHSIACSDLLGMNAHMQA